MKEGWKEIGTNLEYKEEADGTCMLRFNRKQAHGTTGSGNIKIASTDGGKWLDGKALGIVFTAYRKP